MTDSDIKENKYITDDPNDMYRTILRNEEIELKYLFNKKYMTIIDKDNVIYKTRFDYELSDKTIDRIKYAIKNKYNFDLNINYEPNQKVIITIHHPLLDDEIYSVNKSDINTNNTELKQYIYVLELEHNKYYVGKSTNPFTRTGTHSMSMINGLANSRGAKWTQLYKPIKILNIYPSSDNLDEDIYTIKLMRDKGIDNVRGGSFCELNLNSSSLMTLEKMLMTNDDKCYYCKNIEHISKHYAKDCPEKKNKRKLPKMKKISEKELNKPKNKILQYFSALNIMDNSSKEIINKIKPNENNNKNETQTYKCKYCDKLFDNDKNKTFHERFTCIKSEKVKMSKDIDSKIDSIFEQNKYQISKNK